MVYYMFLQIKSVMFKLSRRELHTNHGTGQNGQLREVVNLQILYYSLLEACDQVEKTLDSRSEGLGFRFPVLDI